MLETIPGNDNVQDNMTYVDNKHNTHAIFHKALLRYAARDWQFWYCFVSNLLEFEISANMQTNNYFTVKHFDNVIAEIKWCIFLPHSVFTIYNCTMQYTVFSVPG